MERREQRNLQRGEQRGTDVGDGQAATVEGGEEEEEVGGVGAGERLGEQAESGLETGGEEAGGEIGLEEKQAREKESELAREERIAAGEHARSGRVGDASERRERREGLWESGERRIRDRATRRPRERTPRIGPRCREWLRGGQSSTQRPLTRPESPERRRRAARRAREARLRSQGDRVGRARSPSRERPGRARAWPRGRAEASSSRWGLETEEPALASRRRRDRLRDR